MKCDVRDLVDSRKAMKMLDKAVYILFSKTLPEKREMKLSECCL